MKRLTELWCALALELGNQLCVNMSKDLDTVLRRVESEGFSFLTITLPTFASDVESALEMGRIDSTLFRSFRKRGAIPCFLSGMLSQIFDKTTGVLITGSDGTQYVWAVRQLCLLMKKVELPCKPERVEAALLSYSATDDEIGSLEFGSFPESPLDLKVRYYFETLYWRVLRKLDKSIASYDVVPSHGPGATSDRKYGNEKYVQTEWPARFDNENLFPYGEYVLPRHGLLSSGEVAYSSISPEQELPVRVKTVPKTLSAPRVIAVEPTCMMYMQQGLMKLLLPALEQDRLAGRFLGFTDQRPNGLLAQRGSRDGTLATLDLSEASDRVSYSLVQKLIRPIAPVTWEALDATRSRTALVQGLTRRIHKFASMGSALTFPIEAMVFTAICFAGIEEQRGHRLSEREIADFSGSVRVYGDDIIVPADAAHTVSRSLEAYGLKVNTRKSFSRGKFRESCGFDYYDGELITPVRVRTIPPSRRRDVESLETWVSTMNQFYMAGLWKTSEVVRGWLEAILGPLPVVPRDSGALGLHSFFPSMGENCPTLHIPRVKAWVCRPTSVRRELDGYWALRKCFTGEYSDPLYEKHLTHSGRADGAKLIRRWVPAEEYLPV